MNQYKSRNFPQTSSNSIVWDGEDLPCIQLCNGDTVSDVVYKLALELCKIKKELDLKDLDLKTVFVACIACPQPVKTLFNVLQLIINKIKSIDEIIALLQGGSTAPTGEILITLASCFLPRVDSNGDPVTKLPHSEYTRLIATMVCSILSTVNGLVVRVDATEVDIANIYTILAGMGGEPQVSPDCVAPTNAPMDISAAWELLETQFCQLRTVTGLPNLLLAGISRQPTDLKDKIQLSGTSPMSAITNWRFPVVNAGDALANLWFTVMDIRGAVKAMQDNCCKISCDSIVVDFSIKMNDDRTEIKLFFASKSKIPVGFYDCNPLGNRLVISDSAGNTTDVLIKVEDVVKYILVGGVMTEVPVVVDINATSLDPKLDYYFNMDACMTNGDMTCQKCLTKTATYKDTCAYCEITVTAGTNIGGEILIIYED